MMATLANKQNTHSLYLAGARQPVRSRFMPEEEGKAR